MKHVFFVLFSSLLVHSLAAQEPIDVTDQTIKIGATKSEEIMLGFAAGDKLVFNFAEANGKDLKEVEILEYPSSSRFSDFKTTKIENKVLSISKQGVYIFRFKNSALAGRVCKIRIQRIPANEETKHFNTAVSWVSKQDTSWNSFTKDVVIGYDTVYLQRSKKELVKSESMEELVLNKTERVHSTTNGNGNKTSVFFTLPQNISEANYSKKVVAWAYWIGVGEEANEAWQKNAKVLQTAVKAGATYFTSPLGALAVGAMTDLLIPKLGEDVSYSLVNASNRALFLAGQQYSGWDHGKGVAGFKKFSDPVLCQGTYFICLSNDNIMQGIDATVKVIAITESKEYKDVAYTETVVTPRTEKKLFKEPVVKMSNFPVTGL